MFNYRMKLQYDGARFDGWQRMGKDDGSSTIEFKIKEVLRKMTDEDVEIYVGCRTERGVHALGQVANVKMNAHPSPVEVKNYLNRYLPRDIAVLSVDEVDERFHSQLNAKAKTYIYRLDTGKVASVFQRKYSYYMFRVPDLDAMNQAAQYFLGEHDFHNFTTSKKSKSTVRNIMNITIHEGEANVAQQFALFDESHMITIEITANDYLHNMVRYMIGMLLDVGGGMKSPEAVKEALGSKDVAMSMPAECEGLFLADVIYDMA